MYIKMIIGSNRVSIFLRNLASACKRYSCDMAATSGGGCSFAFAGFSVAGKASSEI